MAENPLILPDGRLEIPAKLLVTIHNQLLLIVAHEEKGTSYDAIGSYLNKYFNGAFKDENYELYQICLNKNIGISSGTLERAIKGQKGRVKTSIRYEFLDFLCFVSFNKQSLAQIINDQKYWDGHIRYSVHIPEYALNEIRNPVVKSDYLHTSSDTSAENQTNNIEKNEARPTTVTESLYELLEEEDQTESDIRYRRIALRGLLIFLIAFALYYLIMRNIKLEKQIAVQKANNSALLNRLPVKEVTVIEPDTIYFPTNVLAIEPKGAFLLSEIAKTKLDTLGWKMNSHPTINVLFTGYVNNGSNYLRQEHSYRQVFSVIRYLETHHKIDSNRCFFQHGLVLKNDMVIYRQVVAGATGPIRPEPTFISNWPSDWFPPQN